MYKCNIFGKRVFQNFRELLRGFLKVLQEFCNDVFKVSSEDQLEKSSSDTADWYNVGAFLNYEPLEFC